jgi:hypothetical protein
VTSAASAPAAQPRATKNGLAISPDPAAFGGWRVGTIGKKKSVIVHNNTGHAVTLNSITFHEGDVYDFAVATNCFPAGHPRTLQSGATCFVSAVFTPRSFGSRKVSIAIRTDLPASPQLLRLNGTGTGGYYITGDKGGVAKFGDATGHGTIKPTPLTKRIIGITTTSNGRGYWMLGADGGVFTFGNAKFYGSTGAMRLNQPVVGMARAADNQGYWLVARDGGIFTFGKVKFYGSTGAMHLNSPIVGMASTRSGNGYWLVAADGGIFCFGDAKFYGSTGGMHLNQPIVAMSRTASGKGYWLVAADGGVFTFGDAKFHGSGGSKYFGVVIDMAPGSNGRGYWLLNSVGQVFTLGQVPYYGDVYRRHIGLAAGIAATAPLLGPRHGNSVSETPLSQMDAHLQRQARRLLGLG